MPMTTHKGLCENKNNQKRKAKHFTQQQHVKHVNTGACN